MNKRDEILAQGFPEIGAGGFTSIDGTVEFYSRINALLAPQMTILDFGGGRGPALTDSASHYTKSLTTFRGKVKTVVVCDVDPAVLSYPGADQIVVVEPNGPLPFSDGFFDLIVSDFVFEHIDEPARVSAELRRILKPGGWICARTNNKYCLLSLATRLISNSLHSSILRWAQPQRQTMDVFPTVYRLNNKRDISKWFPPDCFLNYTYRFEPEPSYFFNNRAIFALMRLIHWLSPPVMKTGLFVFLQKRPAAPRRDPSET